MGRIYERDGITVEKEEGSVETDENTLTFSKKVVSPMPFQDGFILLFLDEPSTQSDPDVHISSTENVARINGSGSLQWVVSAPNDMPESARYVTRHLLHDSRIVTLVGADDWQAYHELNPETGKIVDKWPEKQFKFDGNRFEFDKEIYQIEDAFGETYVETKSGMFAFGEKGTNRWSLRLNTPYNYTGAFAHRELIVGDHQIKLVNTKSGRPPWRPSFILNRRTGRIINGRQMKPDWVREYLADTDLYWWFPTYFKSELAVFTENLDIAWKREFNARISTAATVAHRTVVQTGLGDKRQLEGFDDRGKKVWERSIEGSVTLHVQGETLQMLFDNDGTEIIAELDPETGMVPDFAQGTPQCLEEIDW